MIGKNMYLSIILACVLLAISIGFFNPYSEVRENLPQVEKGILDLTLLGNSRDIVVPLNGEWRMVYGALLEPSDLDQLEELTTARFVYVPGPWKSKESDESIKSLGTATYYLRIKVNPMQTTYGLKLTNIRMAMKLYVNGDFFHETGKVASTQALSTARNVPTTVFFNSNKEWIDILIQVSDFDYKTGGIVQPIFFGTNDQINALNTRLIFYDLLSASILVITAIYFGGIYFYRQKGIGLLFFAFYCVFFAFFVITYNEKLFMVIFPQIPYIPLLQFKQLLLMFCFALLGLSMHLFNNTWISVRVLRVYMVIYILYGIYIASMPFSVTSKTEDLLFLVALSSYILILGGIVKSIKSELLQRQAIGNSILMAFSICFIMIHFISTVLMNLSILHSGGVSTLAIIGFALSNLSYISKQQADAYRQIEELNASLLASDGYKDDFLINTSHELKTPLHGIISITQSILEQDSEGLTLKVREDLNYVTAIAKRLSSLINDIIDFQSIKKGVFYMDIRVIDSAVPIKVVAEILERVYKDKAIEVINDIPQGVYYVKADNNRLRQIVYNLMGNALKYTEEGVVRIYAERHNDSVIFSISDTGIGILADRREAIFNYFEHFVGNFGDHHSASGLGLPIARMIADQMGGRLWLKETNAEEGSIFCFSLIAADKPEVEEALDAKITDASDLLNPIDLLPAEQIKDRQYSILIVDDEISNIKVIQKLYANEPCQIIVAYNGYQAIEAIHNNRDVALVLMDVMMPGITGFDVCRRIRKRYNLFELPVLLLTIKDAPEDIAEGLKAGANDFLTKPFDGQVLKARVETLITLCQSVKKSKDAEIAFLQAQVQPHFLFNTLNSIAALCIKHPEEAEQLTLEFASYLRSSFDFKNLESMITLTRELDHVRHYTAIEKTRYGDRLHIEFDIDEGFHLLIPPLVLQPLVENAIKHGIAPFKKGGIVHIALKHDLLGWEFSVTDNGAGISQSRLDELSSEAGIQNSVGLWNIQKRLRSLYNSDLVIESRPNEGTRVSFHINEDRS